ncbi:hypothetical protein ACGFZP_26750 [Kitasatospora sp. NPDC048239]|uniref:hypothetical protein n=1 Tax=Kitasatospora sp. NPDC048239 TaxID=3364046 RepID=UPI0037241C99
MRAQDSPGLGGDAQAAARAPRRHVRAELTQQRPAELLVLASRAVDFDPKLLPYGVEGIYHPETFAAVRNRRPRP